MKIRDNNQPKILAPAELNPHQQEKKELRKKLLEKRRSLTPTVWRKKSDLLCDRLQCSSLFTKARTILAYFSFRQEPDLSSLFSKGGKWGFPRCVDHSLVWHSWTEGDNLQVGKYGIREPHPDLPILSPTEVDLILVPGVGCDRRGYRLGYGGGFYDRMLSSPEWSNIPTIGIVFDFAYLPELPVAPWDQKLDGVCTDTIG